MLRNVLVILLGTVMVASAAYSPQPFQKSAADKSLQEALSKAQSDSEKVELAKSTWSVNPEDMQVGKTAATIMRKYMTDAENYFKSKADGESIVARYLYAWYFGDTLISAKQADWILKKDPKNFWGLVLQANSEWDKSKPDMDKVRSGFEAAVAADPSQPDGYWLLGYVFQDLDKWQDARSAFDAGANCDPTNTDIRDGRLTVYAQMRDADAYFNLSKAMFPADPLQMDLAFANGTDHLTPAKLLGKTTVLEFWGFS